MNLNTRILWSFTFAQLHYTCLSIIVIIITAKYSTLIFHAVQCPPK